MASLIVSGNTGGKDFTIHPAGVFPARCTRIIELGTTNTEWEGKAKKSRKIAFSFESAELMGQDEGEFAGKPYLITARFTASLGEKANMRKSLEAWRGRKFTPVELEAFNLHNVLGKPCMVNMVHGNGDQGKVYSNIASMMPLPAGLTAPQAVGPLIFFSLAEFDQKVYDSLTDYYKRAIAESDEYKALFGKPALTKAPVGNSAAAAELLYDDIPF